MIAYKVGSEYVNSIFLALHKSWKTGSAIELYCNDHEFDQYNWTVEPVQSLDVLMATHAQNLRNKYDRLILLYSGGTDSHTIYNIFKQNKIHLDEIIVKTDDDTGSIFPKENLVWLQNNHWDPTTTITNYDNHDPFLRSLDVVDEDWVWKDQGDLLKYGMTSTSNGVKFLCEKNHSGTHWRAISGYEKPRLIYRNKHWYSRQMSVVIQALMGHNYVEHFFFEPLIAIKQSHLVKNAVKQLIATTQLPLYDNDWAEAKWPRTYEGYRAWARACGRHDELNLGVSHFQKLTNEALSETEINLGSNWKQLSNTHDSRLQHDLSSGDKVALNYVKGFHNLTAEFGFQQFLQDNNWFNKSSNCFTSLKYIWSKEYDLGS